MLTNKKKDDSFKNGNAESFLCNLLSEKVGTIENYQTEKCSLINGTLKASIEAGADWLARKYFTGTIRSPEYFIHSCSDGEIGSIRTFHGAYDNKDILFAYNDVFHDCMDADVALFIIGCLTDAGTAYTPSGMIQLIADAIVKDVRVGMSLLDQLYGYDFCIVGFKDDRMLYRNFNLYEGIRFLFNDKTWKPFVLKERSDSKAVFTYRDDFEIVITAESDELSESGVLLNFDLMDLKPTISF